MVLVLVLSFILFLYFKRPDSIHMKPAYIMKTRITQSVTQRVPLNDFIDSISILFVVHYFTKGL